MSPHPWHGAGRSTYNRVAAPQLARSGVHLPDQIGPLTFPWPPAGYDQAAWRLLSGRINAERSGVEMIPQPDAAPFPADQAASLNARQVP